MPTIDLTRLVATDPPGIQPGPAADRRRRKGSPSNDEQMPRSFAEVLEKERQQEVGPRSKPAAASNTDEVLDSDASDDVGALVHANNMADVGIAVESNPLLRLATSDRGPARQVEQGHALLALFQLDRARAVRANGFQRTDPAHAKAQPLLAAFADKGAAQTPRSVDLSSVSSVSSLSSLSSNAGNGLGETARLSHSKLLDGTNAKGQSRLETKAFEGTASDQKIGMSVERSSLPLGTEDESGNRGNRVGSKPASLANTGLKDKSTAPMSNRPPVIENKLAGSVENRAVVSAATGTASAQPNTGTTASASPGKAALLPARPNPGPKNPTSTLAETYASLNADLDDVLTRASIKTVGPTEQQRQTARQAYGKLGLSNGSRTQRRSRHSAPEGLRNLKSVTDFVASKATHAASTDGKRSLNIDSTGQQPKSSSPSALLAQQTSASRSNRAAVHLLDKPMATFSADSARDIGPEVKMLLTRTGGRATVVLNGPDGPLRVQIRVVGDRADVIFRATNNDVTQALQQAMNELVASLEESGIQARNVQVLTESETSEERQRQADGANGQETGDSQAHDGHGGDERVSPADSATLAGSADSASLDEANLESEPQSIGLGDGQVHVIV